MSNTDEQTNPDEHGASGRGLKLHHPRPAPGAHKAKTRVGRGEGSKGKTAGRGTKGTKARSQVPASFEGGQMPLHRRWPALPRLSLPPGMIPLPTGNTDIRAPEFPQRVESPPAQRVARATRAPSKT